MKNTVRLLAGAAWLLLGVSWVMSLYAYPRLPPEMASWLGLWGETAAKTGKSLLFFLIPAFQTLLFLGFLFLAKAVLWKDVGSASEQPSPGREFLSRLWDLRKEVVYLASIFLQLVFIHLQTSLVLASHGQGGVNRFYLGMVLAVLVSLIPYYLIRRRMLR